MKDVDQAQVADDRDLPRSILQALRGSRKCNRLKDIVRQGTVKIQASYCYCWYLELNAMSATCAATIRDPLVTTVYVEERGRSERLDFTVPVQSLEPSTRGAGRQFRRSLTLADSPLPRLCRVTAINTGTHFLKIPPCPSSSQFQSSLLSPCGSPTDTPFSRSMPSLNTSSRDGPILLFYGA